ncbi:MAG: hypothetical protein ACD_65C00309G0003 [uncultured bacterium]|nr:MAG: hypothetical protein ACD_65C00309G0003 [uncultured bacterium]
MGGEEVILTFAFMVAQGFATEIDLFIYCYLGTLFSDICWFLSGRHYFKKLSFFEKLSVKYNRIVRFLKKVSGRPFVLLFITKFIYGTRIFTIIYVGLEGLKLSKFILYNIFVISAWLPVVLAVGWLAGRGMSGVVNIYENTGLALLGILVFIIVTVLIRSFISKKAIK